eukprot:9476600-Pyramimonas_sp.AAC.1
MRIARVAGPTTRLTPARRRKAAGRQNGQANAPASARERLRARERRREKQWSARADSGQARREARGSSP